MINLYYLLIDFFSSFFGYNRFIQIKYRYFIGMTEYRRKSLYKDGTIFKKGELVIIENEKIVYRRMPVLNYGSSHILEDEIIANYD